MRRTRSAAAVGLAAAALGLGGCGGDDDATATETETTTTDTTTATDTTTGDAGAELAGTVGPGFTITLETSAGEAVGSLPPGGYTIAVDDESTAHNFHLTGPGVDESTQVSEEGAQTWNVTLEPGTYSFVCDPHASSMNGSFEVSG